LLCKAWYSGRRVRYRTRVGAGRRNIPIALTLNPANNTELLVGIVRLTHTTHWPSCYYASPASTTQTTLSPCWACEPVEARDRDQLSRHASACFEYVHWDSPAEYERSRDRSRIPERNPPRRSPAPRPLRTGVWPLQSLLVLRRAKGLRPTKRRLIPNASMITQFIVHLLFLVSPGAD